MLNRIDYKCHSFVMVRRCRHCGYATRFWPDSGECPNCGEVN